MKKLVATAVFVSFLVTDRLGAHKILKLVEAPVLLWIIPPSLKILQERIQKRGTETSHQIEY